VIRVAIIEDNRSMREGWKTFIEFENDMTVIGAFNSCEDAFESGLLSAANVLLLDISLPGMTGIEGLAIISREYPEVSVIMATVFDDDTHIFSALRAGASGYMLKSTSPIQLAGSIRDVHAGGSPITPTIARRVIDFFSRKAGSTDALNERELQILRELATGLSYAAIGKKIFLSEDGIRYHIRNIYRKLQVNSKTEALGKAYKRGLIAI